MRALIVAAVALSATPAVALTVVSEEAIAIEAACNGIQLGAEQCACIAGDAVTTLDAHMREIVLMSLQDEVGFEIRVKAKEFADDDIKALNTYQMYVQDKCAPGATEG